jgi:hypothetical protein
LFVLVLVSKVGVLLLNGLRPTEAAASALSAQKYRNEGRSLRYSLFCRTTWGEDSPWMAENGKKKNHEKNVWGKGINLSTLIW